MRTKQTKVRVRVVRRVSFSTHVSTKVKGLLSLLNITKKHTTKNNSNNNNIFFAVYECLWRDLHMLKLAACPWYPQLPSRIQWTKILLSDSSTWKFETKCPSLHDKNWKNKILLDWQSLTCQLDGCYLRSQTLRHMDGSQAGSCSIVCNFSPIKCQKVWREIYKYIYMALNLPANTGSATHTCTLGRKAGQRLSHCDELCTFLGRWVYRVIA